MTARDININIDELVLDGFPAGDQRALCASISGELSRLLAERGVPPALLREQGAAARGLRAAVTIEAGEAPARAGARVAEAIYRGWSRSERRGDPRGEGGGPR